MKPHNDNNHCLKVTEDQIHWNSYKFISSFFSLCLDVLKLKDEMIKNCCEDKMKAIGDMLEIFGMADIMHNVSHHFLLLGVAYTEGLSHSPSWLLL